jgi:uncharacterized protein YaiL (DUF2058 family)
LRLLLNGGDGDQSYFSTSTVLEEVQREWFDDNTVRGPAKLVRLLNGPHAGEYAALTSRVLASIDEQLVERHTASIILNVVKRRAPTDEDTPYVLDSIGMGIVEVMG